MDYSQEVLHSTDLIIRGKQPFNAEPHPATLVEFNYTPEQLIYCRNHGPVDDLDEDDYSIEVGGLVKHQLNLTIASLRKDYTPKTVVAALQCAGNRRKEMAAIKPVKGIIWDCGVMANCRWTGVRLRDVLLRAGVDPQQGGHVWFASHVTQCQDDAYYGASIPLAKAMSEDGDVILALDMNDQPLSPDHGYPLRVVVPGFTGARWVKWVDRITLASTESPNFYQQRDYRVLPPNIETAEEAAPLWDKYPSIEVLPINSVVAAVNPVDTQIPPGTLRVKGYAMAAGGSGGARVKRVQVSSDGGASWGDARITYQEGPWSWTLWECTVNVDVPAEAHEVEVLCRAEDEHGVVQKSECGWNFRGVAFNAYGRGRWRW